MYPFILAEPQSLTEVAKLLQTDGARPMAGGTALMLMMKAGVLLPETLVSLRRIEPRYAQIAADSDGTLRIGAMTTLRQLELSQEVAKAAPVLANAMRRLANVRVRNVATVGGALAHADPHLDLPPVLIALGATLSIAGPSGERTLAVEDLFTGYLETALEPGELIAAVVIPSQDARRAAYLKHTTRSADDWPALGIAVSAMLGNGKLQNVRAAIGAATDTPRRLPAAEAALAGKPLDAAAMQAAGDAAAGEAEVHSDARGTAPYKRELIRVFVRRALQTLAEGGQGQ